MPSYTLTDLARLADVTPRTIRYYITQGLLPSPGQQGPGTRYDDTHLELLRLIKKLQNAHFPLAEIRARLRSITGRQMAAIASSADAAGPPDSAVDYIRRVMGDPTNPAARVPTPAAAPAPTAPTAAGMPSPPSSSEVSTAYDHIYQNATKEPDFQRSQWERIPLDLDVELHVRRPLTRQHNKRVERLVTIARQLFEED